MIERSSEIQIDRMHSGELGAVYALLGAVSLPIEGLDAHLDSVLVARRGATVIGSVALEIYEDGALLRSLAVAESDRGRGLGAALTNAALDFARERDVESVFLLTETAEAFFPRFGFQSVDRSAVPAGVRQSLEFTTLCPDTAAVQSLAL